MNWFAASHLYAALACAVACGALGGFVPELIRRLPEPRPEPVGEPASGDKPAKALPPAPPKEPYTDIAALPRLAAWSALWSALIGAVIGASLGWTGALAYLVPLVPIGAALALIDWRTTLLPTRIIAPTYGLLLVLIPVAALIDSDSHALLRAVYGWLVLGGWFFVFWFIVPAIWGYGDVRLSGVLGLALGYVGWDQMFFGLFAIAITGGLGGLVLTGLKITSRKRFPYGPFMLVGSVLGIAFGPQFVHLGY
ncbi:MAG: peptidase prepilin type [Marmoricola sp.]|jgi:leader peptidase (prepilin peptidase)/N-methyltransferase|nr:peptidase prepilin type [Marmoricola sp.]